MVTAISVILFNPTESSIKNILSISSLFNYLILIDNSAKPTDLHVFDRQKNVIRIINGHNLGFAKALNQALAFSEKNGIDYLFTSDQDSIFKKETIEKALLLIDEYPENQKTSIGIFALNTEAYNQNKKAIEFVNYVITSGNFLNIKSIKRKAVSFNDSLFVDYVDFDFDYKLIKGGLKIALLSNLSFNQTIGSPLHKKILFFEISSMNHGAIRDFYRYRNETYLYRLDKRFFKRLHLGEAKEFLKMLLIEKNKRQKWRAYWLGVKAGKRGILGPVTKDQYNWIIGGKNEIN